MDDLYTLKYTLKVLNERKLGLDDWSTEEFYELQDEINEVKRQIKEVL
jgi:hypothetical protein